MKKIVINGLGKVLWFLVRIGWIAEYILVPADSKYRWKMYKTTSHLIIYSKKKK